MNPRERLRVLLLEPWLGGSHGRWAQGYQAVSEHRVAVLGLDAELWRWRLRGGAVPLARQVRDWIAANGQPDRLVVSSPLDCARLSGLLRAELSGVPVVVYQHESQLLYPNPGGQAAADDGALYDWFSWLAADEVWFATDWHRTRVTEALPAFLDRLPATDHRSELGGVVARFASLPLGLDLAESTRIDAGASSEAQGPVILWPHRWEPDKDPAAFVAAIDRLATAGFDFSLILAGELGPGGSIERDRLRADHAEQIVAVGPFTDQKYRQLLGRADIVVSCARHEFFGAAVAEAVAAGCVPVVPDALAYPEILGAPGRAGLYPPGTFGSRLLDVVANLEAHRAAVADLAPSMHRYDWSVVGPRYDERLVRVDPRPTRGSSRPA